MGTVARVAVGVVLVAAGAAKLAQPAWPATAAAFGAPPSVAAALPWAELVLGAALVAGLGLPWAAWAALALLAGFTAAVVDRLRRGDRVPCGCFGEPSPVPLGPATVARNAVLCGLAALAALGGDGGGPGAVAGGAVLGLAVVAGSRLRGRRR